MSESTLNGIKYISIVVQPSPLSISRSQPSTQPVTLSPWNSNFSCPQPLITCLCLFEVIELFLPFMYKPQADFPTACNRQNYPIDNSGQRDSRQLFGSCHEAHFSQMWLQNAKLMRVIIHNSKGLMHPDVHCSTIYNSKDLEAMSMSISRGMDREAVVRLDNGILLSHKKGRCNAVCSDMDGPQVCHTEPSKSDTERQIHDITYLWNLK